MIASIFDKLRILTSIPGRLLALAGIFAVSHSAAQVAPAARVARAEHCEKYEESLRLGYMSLKADSSGMALRRFQDAQIAARQCSIPGKEAADGIIKAFTDINNKKLLSEKKANEAQSLALSSQAFTEIYKNGNVTKAFRYAQYAYLKDTTNLNAQTAMNLAVYQPDADMPLQLFYSDVPNNDNYINLDIDPCGKAFFIEDDAVKVIDVAGGKTRIINHIGTRAVLAMDADADIKYALSPSGTILYVHMLYYNTTTRSQVEEVDVFDIESGKKLCKVAGHDRNSVSFSHDDSRIVFNDEQVIRAYNVRTGKMTPTVPFPGHTIDSVIFSGDGNVFAIQVEMNNDSFSLFVLGTDQLDIRGRIPLNHEELNSWLLSDDGAYLLLKRGDKPAEIYSTSPFQLIMGAKPAAYHFPAGLYITQVKLAATDRDEKKKIISKGTDVLRISDISSDKTVECRQPSQWSAANFNEVVFSSDRKRLVSLSENDFFGRGNKSSYPFTLWNAVTGKNIVTVQGGNLSLGPVQNVSVLFSPDSKYFITTDYSKKVTLWNANSGKKIAELSHTEIVDKAVFSSDSKYIITTTQNFLLKKFPLASLTDPTYLPGQLDNGYAEAAHLIKNADKVTRANNKNYDTNKVVIQLADTTVKISVVTSFMSRDRNDNARKRNDKMEIIRSGITTGYFSVKDSFKDYTNYMLTARISADGKYLLGTFGIVFKVAMNSYEDFPKYSVLWDIGTGRMITKLAIADGTFSPNSKFLIMCGGAEMALVDVKSGTELTRFRMPLNPDGHNNYCRSDVHFTTNGKILARYRCGEENIKATGSTIKAYIIDPKTLIESMKGIGDLRVDEKGKYNIKLIGVK